jgi:hypothetical protein
MYLYNKEGLAIAKPFCIFTYNKNKSYEYSKS